MRLLRFLLVALLLVVLLALVAGEVIARPLAERAVAADVQTRYNLDQRPRISLGGFPFLVRVALGHLPSATGRLRNVTVEGFTVQDAQLHLSDVRFDAVRLARGNGRVSAEHGQAQATISDVDLTNYLVAQGVPVEVHFMPNEVTVSGTVTVARTEIRVQATGNVAISDRQLTFVPQSIDASAASITVPADVLDAFRRNISFSVPIPEVAGVQLTDIELGTGTATMRADLAGYILSG